MQLSPQLKLVMDLAEQAGEVLKKYHGKALDVRYKKDEFDPVSVADRESDDLIRAGLAKAFPNDEILSEENAHRPLNYEGKVWMVDPLDDTKGYLAGRNTPGVMIGLLDAGVPTLGVVYLPFRDVWYYAGVGQGAFRVKDGKTERLKANTVAAISESRLVGRIPTAEDTRPIETAINELGFKSIVSDGCVGAKIGLVAAGEAEAFVHTNLRAGKWDTLAGQVILNEAGGVMADVKGKPLDYQQAEADLGKYFVAACTANLLQQITDRLKNFKD